MPIVKEMFDDPLPAAPAWRHPAYSRWRSGDSARRDGSLARLDRGSAAGADVLNQTAPTRRERVAGIVDGDLDKRGGVSERSRRHRQLPTGRTPPDFSMGLAVGDRVGGVQVRLVLAAAGHCDRYIEKTRLREIPVGERREGAADSSNRVGRREIGDPGCNETLLGNLLNRPRVQARPVYPDSSEALP